MKLIIVGKKKDFFAISKPQIVRIFCVAFVLFYL